MFHFELRKNVKFEKVNVFAIIVSDNTIGIRLIDRWFRIETVRIDYCSVTQKEEVKKEF